MGAGTILVYASNITISYTPPNASLNTLLTGELVVPSQMPIPGAEPLKLLGLGSIGLGLARLGGYAFGKQSDSPDRAQLPPWQEARVVTPISYMTEPLKDAGVSEVEETIAPATHLEPPPVPEPVAIAKPAPQVAEPITSDPAHQTLSEQPLLTPAPAPTSAIEPPAPETPSVPLTVIPQPQIAQEAADPSQPVAIAPAEVGATVPPTDPSDSTTTGQAVNPLGIVSHLVEVVTNPSMPQHLAIAGIPRGGKSYTLRGIIWGIKQVEPKAIIRIVDPKNSPVGWLGLEKIPSCVRFAHHGLESALDTINEAIALLDRAIDTRETRQNAYFIFDDWSSLLAEAKRLDAKMAIAEPQAARIYPDLIYNMERLALKGLEYGIHLILATHSWDCVEFGFDAQCRFAFALVALGRQGRWEALSSLLKSEVSIPDDDVRDRLARQKNEAIEKVRDRECPIMLLAGDGGVLDALPDFEWLDWVDLSVFADKLAPDPEALHRNGNASKPMAEMV